MLTRIITGYPGTNAYLFKRVRDSPKCLYGPITQDMNHIFWACPVKSGERETSDVFENAEFI